MIFAFGLLPVIVLCYSIGRTGRPKAGELPSENMGVPAA